MLQWVRILHLTLLFFVLAGITSCDTTKQAAAIAQKAGVGKLLIGHFSSKYSVLDLFAQEAREVFPNTELALEGVTYNIR